MVDAVTPTSEKPKHHITLSDGTTTVGLIAVKRWTNKDGEIITTQDENQIDVSPSQPLAIQTSQGDSAYSDREWPYMTLVQESWAGGRGGETFEDDKSRYFDGERVNAWREGSLTLGPLETYTKNTNAQQYMPGATAGSGVTWGVLYGASRYRSTIWTQDGSWTHDQNIEVIVRKIGSPGTLTLRLAANTVAGDDPDATLGTDPYVIGTNTGATLEANKSYVLTIGCDTNFALVDTTKYHIEVYGAATDDADDHWEVATATGSAGGKISVDGAAYLPGATLYYRILAQFTDATKWATSWVQFEYKGALYAYSQPPSGNSFLYINGDRGVADSNVGDKNNVEDASKAWTAYEWIGCKVKIIAGPGSEEYQPWRTITDNDTNTLVCSGTWNITHTTSTEYVIVGSDKWTSLLDLGGYVTDHAVTADYIYFARSGLSIKRYQWYNSGVAEAARSTDEEVVHGDYLLSIHHPEDEHDTLYVGRNDHAQYGVAVGKMRVPGTWNHLAYSLGKLAYTNTPWADRSIANCTQTTDDQATKVTVTAAFTTGLCAVQNLAQPVDITKANKIGVWIKSTVAVANTELYLVYDDFLDTDGDANKLIRKSTPKAVTQCTSGVHATAWNAMDGEPATSWALTYVTATDAIYIVSDFKFDTIYFDLGATKNVVANSVMTADYFRGYDFNAVAITDNTIATTSTLGASGTITFTPPQDWKPFEILDDVADSGATYRWTGYMMRLHADKDLTAAVAIENVMVYRSNTKIINLGALVAGEWTYAVASITPEKFPAPDDTQVQSVGLYIEDDFGAAVLFMKDGIDLLYDEPDWKPLPSDEKITNMIAHNGNIQEPRTNPWIFTEGAQLYEMQSQNEDQFIPMTIGEMGAFRSENTGRAACVNDVYLYFSLGEERLERWFNNSLDDIGPDGEFYYGK